MSRDPRHMPRGRDDLIVMIGELIADDFGYCDPDEVDGPNLHCEKDGIAYVIWFDDPDDLPRASLNQEDPVHCGVVQLLVELIQDDFCKFAVNPDGTISCTLDGRVWRITIQLDRM